MSRRSPVDRHVTVSLDLPIEVAEYLRDHGVDLISAVEKALREYERNPPPDVAIEREEARQEEREERKRQYIAVGRLGYRLLRHRERAYLAVEGRSEPHKGAKRETWRRHAIAELAQRRSIAEVAPSLSVDFNCLYFAIPFFRKRFRSRLKQRRRREFMRLARLGLTNVEIAARYGLNPQTVSLHLKEALRELRAARQADHDGGSNA